MLEQLLFFKCLYFGCINEAGHYLFTRDKTKTYGDWYRWAGKRDGTLAPTFCKEPGKALLHHYDGFTMLAFWDYSVDSRPGSNSMFIVPGIKGFEETIEVAKANFPQVFERFPFELVQINPIPRDYGAIIKEYEEAKNYLLCLLETIMPEAEPFDDLPGLCTQVDHAIAGQRDADILSLRQMLWMRHGDNHILYGDDGEMQCSTCMVDFKRSSVADIFKRFHTIAMQQLSEQHTKEATKCPECGEPAPAGAAECLECGTVWD